MADVAQLGIAVDSGQVKSATAALNQFNQASAQAQKGADNLTEASRKTGPALSTVESMARRAGVSVEEMQRRVNAASAGQQQLAVASQTAVKGMQQLSTQATKAANDNKALGDQTDKSTGALEKFALRFTRGLIAGAAIAAVQQLTQYLFNLNAAVATTADTAERTGMSYAKFQGLTTAAGYKGLGSNELNSGMIPFAQQVDFAKNGLGSLQTLLRANGQTVSDTATSFGKVADLVMAAAGNTRLQFSILQQAGLPATREWAKFMEQGSAAINKSADASTKLSDQQLREAKAVNDKWNEYWTNFENWGKRAAVNVLGFLSGIGSIGAGPQADRAPFRVNIPTGGLGGGDGKPTKPPFDPELAKQQISLEQQRLGLLGPLISAEEARRQVELQLQSAGLNNVAIDGKRAETLKQLAYETALGITAIKANTDAFNVEAQTIGMSTGQAAAYTAAQTVLNEKKRLGIAVSDEQRAAIMREAESMGRAKEAVENLRFAHDTFTSSFVDFGQQIRNGASAWDAFRTAGTNALGKIADKLMTMATDKLWTSAFGGAGSSGGFLGSVFGGIGKLFAAADGGTFGPGWGVVGERGPELINVHSRGVTVIPNHISKPYLPGFAEGGMLSQSGNVTRLPFGQNNEPTTVINYSPNIDARGADAAAVARLEIAMARNQRDFEKNVIGVQMKHRINTPGSNR